MSSDDVRGVQKRFDEEDMPVDVFWLDIEHAEEHKYFIWDEKTFPDPVEMTKDVEALGRKVSVFLALVHNSNMTDREPLTQMVVIVDPHLKRANSYPVYKSASDLGILVKPKSGEGEYEGWCWPGSSSWVDFFNPASWDWWIKKFRTEEIPGEWTWTKSTDSIYIWNDMNEVGVSQTLHVKGTDAVSVLCCSRRFSMGRRSRCRRTMFTMEDGSIVTCTISMECSSYAPSIFLLAHSPYSQRLSTAQHHFPRADGPLRSPEEAICPDALILRRLATFRCDVDW